MANIKVGIIGTGFIGATHIDTLRRIGGVELVALADVNYPAAQKKAEEYGIPKVYGSMDALIDDPEIQVEAYYGFIRAGRRPGVDPADFATFADGHYIMRLTEAIIKSGKERRWVRIDEI